MNRPPATISVDVDPVDLHLEGYGVHEATRDARVYTHALPRLARHFEVAGVRATFFVVARDAPAHAATLKALRAAGHEIASHSLTHPLALARAPGPELERETAGAREVLEAAVGGAVVGFRTPHFDAGVRVLEALARAGYRYDASDYPSPLLAVARLALLLRGHARGGALRLSRWPRTMRRRPHRVDTPAGTIVAFPLTVTRLGRWPVYHTLRYGVADRAFEARLEALARRGEPLSYALHAVDALGLTEDGVDPRLAGHPGMRLGLEAKLGLLDRTLAAIVRRFEPRPFAERLREEE